MKKLLKHAGREEGEITLAFIRMMPHQSRRNVLRILRINAHMQQAKGKTKIDREERRRKKCVKNVNTIITSFFADRADEGHKVRQKNVSFKEQVIFSDDWQHFCMGCGQSKITYFPNTRGKKNGG